jgi:hypothetical protein
VPDTTLNGTSGSVKRSTEGERLRDKGYTNGPVLESFRKPRAALSYRVLTCCPRYVACERHFSYTLSCTYLLRVAAIHPAKMCTLSPVYLLLLS